MMIPGSQTQTWTVFPIPRSQKHLPYSISPRSNPLRLTQTGSQKTLMIQVKGHQSQEKRGKVYARVEDQWNWVNHRTPRGPRMQRSALLGSCVPRKRTHRVRERNTSDRWGRKGLLIVLQAWQCRAIRNVLTTLRHSVSSSQKTLGGKDWSVWGTLILP